MSEAAPITSNDIKMAITICSGVVAALIVLVSGMSYCTIQQGIQNNQQPLECIKNGGNWTVAPPQIGRSPEGNYICIHGNT